MTLTGKKLSSVLHAELDKGYDVVIISRVAFQIHQEQEVDLNLVNYRSAVLI